MANLFGTFSGPKYDGKYLRSMTNNFLGDLTLKDTLTNVLIPAFDVKLLQPVIFSTHDVWKIEFICIITLFSLLDFLGLN